MIKTQKLTPEIYYKESRDFQFFGRLYDVLFNYLKTETDLIRSFPLNNTQNTIFAELILKTLGFRNLREYQLDQLLAVAKSWIRIIKNKGSLEAVHDVVRLILRTENLDRKYEVYVENSFFDNVPTIVIRIKDLISSEETSLLEEMLNYILPIGIGYVVQNVSILDNISVGNIMVEEHTSLKESTRKQLSSLAKQNTTMINEEKKASGYSGKFTDEYAKDDLIEQGNIRVGTINKE